MRSISAPWQNASCQLQEDSLLLAQEVRMLRIIPSTSVDRAKSYFSTADYYSEGQELAGIWRGEDAKRLGLEGVIEQKDWDSLCDNRNPQTGETLTARRKGERRVGWDFNFHAPKRFSLLYALTQNECMLDAFRESMRETMQDIEDDMKTRVRKGGKNEDRITGNAAYGEYIHFTSRPVDNEPDMHVHGHNFLFNISWDEVEQRFKAAQIGDIKRDAPYYQALFHARLARRIEELGIPIERSKKGWDIAGITELTADKFSRRTAEIEKKAKDDGIVDPREKDGLGAKTRSRKQKELSMDELRSRWRARLSPDESDAIELVSRRIGTGPITEKENAAKDAISHALAHCFVHKSVVPERDILAEAMRHSVGRASAKSIARAFADIDLIRGERKGRKMVTTPEILKEEQRMTAFARDGRGTCSPFVSKKHVFQNKELNKDQRKAVRHVLESSRDRVILIRGAAGTGKTWMMREAVDAIEATGKSVFVFAPSSRASKSVLREQEGFTTADTVAQLLNNQQMQRDIRGQVIWIDEAGLLDSPTMVQVFDLADKNDVRVILSGDRRQHGSVERGAVLRLLEEECGIVPAELKEIQRQKGKYKQLVQALSEGEIEEGFKQLDDLNWIKEISEVERYKTLAADYLSTIAEGKTALVVSPTHFEIDRCTREIRAGLKASGKLGIKEEPITVLENLNLTPAERADAINYVPGDVLVFHQNAKGGYTKGDRVVVGKEKLPLDQALRFQVFHPVKLAIAPDEVVRVTRNGYTRSGKRLDNGAIYPVKGLTDAGNIRLKNGEIIDKNFGFLDYGYAVTSYASQSATVDRVLIAQSSASFPASSQEQLYVSVSRGRHEARIYTDNKQSLLEAVRRGDERLTATEFVSNKERQRRYATLSRINERIRALSKDIARTKSTSHEERRHAR